MSSSNATGGFDAPDPLPIPHQTEADIEQYVLGLIKNKLKNWLIDTANDLSDFNPGQDHVMKRADFIELFKALQAYLQRFPNATFKIGRKRVVGGEEEVLDLKVIIIPDRSLRLSFEDNLGIWSIDAPASRAKLPALGKKNSRDLVWRAEEFFIPVQSGLIANTTWISIGPWKIAKRALGGLLPN